MPKNPCPGAERLHAAQLWIALPPTLSGITPAFEHYPVLPTWQQDGCTLTMLAGQLDGQQTPTRLYSDLLGLDLLAHQDSTVSLALRPDFEYGILPLDGEQAGGFYVQPTLFKGHNKMRIFQEEIFGPVLAVTTFKDEAEALAIANDTLYGLGAGVWSRNGNVAYRMGRAIKAGRVWTNCYHAYPAHAAFGGYKESGIGRETHKMMLDHYQQTKNLLVSYSENKLGFF